MFFHELASDKIIAMTIGPDSSGANVLAITRWHAPTGMPEFVQQEFLTITGEFVWMRQQDDSTDVIFEISRDGNLFEEVYREARGSLFSVAPDRAGVGGFTMGGPGMWICMRYIEREVDSRPKSTSSTLGGVVDEVLAA